MGLIQTANFLLTHPLGRRARATTLRRFLQWQLASRLSPGPIAAPFAGGARLLVERGMTGATGNVYVGLHEFADMAFLLHLLRAEDTFLDVGANIGSYTVLAAKAVGARCIAVEPIAATVEHLMDNLRLNAIDDLVRVERCAVGDTRGVLRMTSDQDTVNRVVADDAASAAVVDVPVKTLDDIVGDGPTPQLMKMDIEGYELSALLGGPKLLSNPELRACIIEVWSASDVDARRGDRILDIMSQFGFQPALYDGFARTTRPTPGISRTGNTLFLRDTDWIELRTRTARTFAALDQMI